MDNEWHSVNIDLIFKWIVNIYYDGILVDSDLLQDVSNSSDNDESLDIGINWDFSDTFNGNLDNIQIWNISLSQEEIQGYITCLPAGNEQGLVGYWNFEEGSGETVFDLSPNGNNGTINGAIYSDDVPEQNCSNSCDAIEIEGFTYGGYFNGSNYYISNQPNEWNDAYKIVDNGGNLPIISSEEENNFAVFVNPSLYSQLWFGFDVSNEGLAMGRWK